MNESLKSDSHTGTRIAVISAVALGIAGIGVIGSQVAGGDPTIAASADGTAYSLSNALDDVDVAPQEVIRIDSTGTADATDAESTSPVDDIVDQVGDVASTVGDNLSEFGACILDLLPDVFGGGDDVDIDVDVTGADVDTAVEAAESACGDLLPSFDDFGGIDLSELNVDEIGDLDLGDLGDIADFEFPDIRDLDQTADSADFLDEVKDVVIDMAEDVVDFVKELPNDLRDRFDDLFGD